jgi:hypothetical protein
VRSWSWSVGERSGGDRLITYGCEVTAGPFAEFVGELEHLDPNGRVRVLLELMGGKTRVALPQTLLAPN